MLLLKRKFLSFPPWFWWADSRLRNFWSNQATVVIVSDTRRTVTTWCEMKSISFFLSWLRWIPVCFLDCWFSFEVDLKWSLDWKLCEKRGKKFQLAASDQIFFCDFPLTLVFLYPKLEVIVCWNFAKEFELLGSQDVRGQYREERMFFSHNFYSHCPLADSPLMMMLFFSSFRSLMRKL